MRTEDARCAQGGSELASNAATQPLLRDVVAVVKNWYDSFRTMAFTAPTIVGHDVVRAYLARRIARGTLPSTLLLCGPASVGKSTVARSVIAGYLCGAANAGEACGACPSCVALRHDLHPDVHAVTNEETVSVEEVRDLLRALSLTPSLGHRRAVLIEHAECMNAASANALLKTLEEPPANALIVLVASSLESILPTVRSRCATLFFHSVGRDAIAAWLTSLGATPSLVSELAQLAAGRPGAAVGLLRSPEALAEHRQRTAELLAVLAAPRERRLALLQKRIPKGEGAMLASRALLDAWTVIGRDALLHAQRNDDCLLNVSIRDASLPNFSQEQLFNFLRRLREARSWLQHHVRPDLALAYCMVPL